ncbi:MAG: hypothetical protein ACOVNS_03230, partial [Erythrobacter sp.]
PPLWHIDAVGGASTPSAFGQHKAKAAISAVFLHIRRLLILSPALCGLWSARQQAAYAPRGGAFSLPGNLFVRADLSEQVHEIHHEQDPLEK